MDKPGKLLLFGAGKIGRSFVGQLFSQAGYHVVFVDINAELVNSLNEKKSYTLVTLDSNHPEKESSILISNCRALHLDQVKEIIEAISDTDIIATSVGKFGLDGVLDVLSEGLNQRFNKYPLKPIDIIIAENIRNADVYLKKELIKKGLNIPLESYVGLIETSIGKMVPIMTREQEQADPLAVHAESYNTLILAQKGFRNPVPDVPGLSPKNNIKAWVDRKLFIHNMGHAALAYQANYHHPDLIYTWEALEIPSLREKVSQTMFQSAGILNKMHPDEFNKEQLHDHVEDLLERFSNKALGDTIFRVGCDLKRKLAVDDRLIVPVLAGIKQKLQYDLILEAWIKGCCFEARDGNGKELTDDIEFRLKYKREFNRILEEHCGLKPGEFPELFESLEKLVKLNQINTI